MHFRTLDGSCPTTGCTQYMERREEPDSKLARRKVSRDQRELRSQISMNHQASSTSFSQCSPTRTYRPDFYQESSSTTTSSIGDRLIAMEVLPSLLGLPVVRFTKETVHFLLQLRLLRRLSEVGYFIVIFLNRSPYCTTLSFDAFNRHFCAAAADGLARSVPTISLKAVYLFHSFAFE